MDLVCSFRAAREGNDLTGLEYAFFCGPKAQGGRSGHHEQQFLVGVMKMQRRDHRARLELIQIRRQTLGTGVLG